jgi:hypothetical protein
MYGNRHTYWIQHQFRIHWPLAYLRSAQLNWTNAVVFVSLQCKAAFQQWNWHLSTIILRLMKTVTWSLHSNYKVCTQCFGSGSSCWFMLLLRLYWFTLPEFLTALNIRVLCCTWLTQSVRSCVHFCPRTCRILLHPHKVSERNNAIIN